jgi:preprotein translocase subunit SecD
MVIGRNRFNIYLLLALAAAILAGCRTPSDRPDKRVATLRVHLEVTPTMMDFSRTVPVYRANPVLVTVDKSPFLTEADVASAKVVDVRGGFNLEIKFNRQGSWILEEYTATHPGKHLAVFSEFGGRFKEGRWLGAPTIRHRISDGVLSFAPDATRPEAEEIALELNNVAKKNEKDSQW